MPGSLERMLVFDDDSLAAARVADFLREYSTQIHAVTSMRDAISALQQSHFDVAFVACHRADVGHTQYLQQVIKHDSQLVVVATAQNMVPEIYSRLLRAGAFDVIRSPLELSLLPMTLERIRRERIMRLELHRLREALAPTTKTFIAVSHSMRHVLSVIERVASSTVNVLVTGPSGVGKEWVARNIHERSSRSQRPFVAVNCAAIPAEMVDCELFGNNTTSGHPSRLGYVQSANEGTLFLEQVGSLPLPTQERLLRTLQEQATSNDEGALNPRDLRVIASERRDCRELVREGTLTDALFYWLSAVDVHIPPLKDRPEDLMPLAEAALHRACMRSKKGVPTFHVTALRSLFAYEWPGNVRELEAAIDRAVALTQGDSIMAEDLPFAIVPNAADDFLRPALDRGWTLDELSRAYLQRALERTGGNKKQAASLLGIDRRTIQRWLGDFGTEDPTGTNAPHSGSTREKLRGS